MIEVQELKEIWDEEVYEMMVQIPAEESGLYNHAYGLNKEEYKKWTKEMINSARGIELKEGYVPQTIYIIFAEGKPVGYLKIRHRLSDELKENGGHIGIVIEKSSRGKGYGTEALQKAVEILETEFHETEILETIHENNKSSRRIAEKNGFVLEETKDGICKYWRRTNERKEISEN